MLNEFNFKLPEDEYEEEEFSNMDLSSDSSYEDIPLEGESSYNPLALDGASDYEQISLTGSNDPLFLRKMKEIFHL